MRMLLESIVLDITVSVIAANILFVQVVRSGILLYRLGIMSMVHGGSIKSISSYGGGNTAFVDTNQIYHTNSAYKEGWNFQSYS